MIHSIHDGFERSALCIWWVALVGLAACSGPAEEPAEAFDLYRVGVPVARLAPEASAEGASRFTAKFYDPFAAVWSTPRSMTAAELEEADEFGVPGILRAMPALLGDLPTWGWDDANEVDWPGRNVTLVRHRELVVEVEGREARATYWAALDGTLPTDLIVDDAGRLIAAVEPTRDLVFVRRGYENATTIGRWRADDISQPDHGVRELGIARVEMPDGIRLSTLVYLPDGDTEGPFPTIFVRTPYGLEGLIQRYFPHVTRGFAVVVQATRGTSYWDPEHRSEGVWEPLVHEPGDGAAALRWIAEQPWSNGDVCMEGGSYLGYTQWATTMADDPALACVVPESSMGTVFSDQPYMGGGFVEGLAYYMFWMLDRPILEGRTWTDILSHRPIADMDVFATGEDIEPWNAMVDHWRNDAYWKRQDWYADAGPREFGSLQISGWWDDDYPGTQSNWELMQRRGVGPQHLVVGPWKHGYNAERRLNGFDFGPEALRDDIWLLKQSWYDHFLKGTDNGVAGTRVDYFVLGDNEWRVADAWPPPDAVEQRWYLHSDGTAASSIGGGGLSTEPPGEQEPADRYVYDPTDPPSNWTDFEGMEQWEDIQSFPADFAEMEARDDVAVFTSAPLEDDLTIAGPIVVELHASTDVLDTDWWAHVSDMHPDGRSVRLSTGLIRARFRDLDDPVFKVDGSNFETERLLSGDPDEVVRYVIGLPAVANTFRAGHRIRIAVMNALDNYSFPNSNTGGHEAYVTTTRPGAMAIHHGPGMESHVRFSVLPATPR